MRTLGVALVMLGMGAASARAESPPIPCYGRGARPGVVTVPANLPAFAFDAYESGWVPVVIDAGTGVLDLERLEGTDRVRVAGMTARLELEPLEARYAFWPDAPLVEGVTHELRWAGCRYEASNVTSYSVGPAIPLPAGDVTLAAHTEAIAIGHLLDRFEWVVELEVAGADVEAWNDLLDMSLLEPIAHPSRAEGSVVRFRVPLSCDGYAGALVPHSYPTAAAIRDLGLRPILSAEAMLEASCDAPRFVEDGTGRLLSEGEIAALHRREPDAGLPDAGPMDAGPRDAGSFDASPGEPARGSCSAVPARTSGWPFVLAGLAIVVARRR